MEAIFFFPVRWNNTQLKMKCFATLSCALAAAAALSLSSVVAERVVYDWHLGYKHVNPDGLHQRRVISINDQWPYVVLVFIEIQLEAYHSSSILDLLPSSSTSTTHWWFTYTTNWTNLLSFMHMASTKITAQTSMMALAWWLNGKRSSWTHMDRIISLLVYIHLQSSSPIPPNYDFTYEFPVTQAGTFWIHSHFKVGSSAIDIAYWIALIHSI